MTKMDKPAAFSRRAVLKAGGALVVSIGAPIGLDALLGHQAAFAESAKPPLMPDQLSSYIAVNAAGLEHGAAREHRGFVHLGHVRLPQPAICSAARLTARRMPMWVPHRHLRPSSAWRISASVGFFLVARNAAAVMIQPLMQ